MINININKMKTNFRIICLKNDQTRKYRDEQIKNTNIIVPLTEKKEKIGSEGLIPNLVHLSARLQDDSQEMRRPGSQSYRQQDRAVDKQNIVSNEELASLTRKRVEELKRLKNMQIHRFFEEKLRSKQKDKNTMKNLLGSINFSSNKKREKKISRMINQTIREVCSTQRTHKKYDYSENPSAFQNKLLLQSDFHNFLANKQQQNNAPVEENQDAKLKKLSMVNPEQEVLESARVQAIQPLNLFHFQNKKITEKKLNLRQNARNLSSSSVKAQSFLGRSRLQKMMFNFQANLKTEEQQFQWSKLKKDGFKYKNFTLRTLDL